MVHGHQSDFRAIGQCYFVARQATERNQGLACNRTGRAKALEGEAVLGGKVENNLATAAAALDECEDIRAPAPNDGRGPAAGEHGVGAATKKGNEWARRASWAGRDLFRSRAAALIDAGRARARTRNCEAVSTSDGKEAGAGSANERAVRTGRRAHNTTRSTGNRGVGTHESEYGRACIHSGCSETK